MSDKYAVGIDIGGTNTKFGIVDKYGKILSRGSIRTTDYGDVPGFISALKDRLVPILKEAGPDNIKGIGIGAPNGNFYRGTIENAPNLVWKGVIPLAKLVEEAFSLPANLTNDANAAAVGEMKYGAARGMKDFIMITLGTGVGSGIIANGRLILGHDGFAGELGHITVIPGGRFHPATGLSGSLECYASATGVVRTANEFLAESGEESLMREIPLADLDSKAIYECALQGDRLAKLVFEFTGKVLGEALANCVMFSSPEAIILFGGLTKAGNLIMEPVKEHMEKNILANFRNKVKLMFSELGEADAAILGASALVWDARP